MPIAQHLMFRLADGRVLAPSPDARCQLARSVLRIGRGFGLLAFRGADSHLHVEAACSRREAGELGRRVELSLGRTLELPVPFAPVHIKPVNDQRHAATLFDYTFRQEQHHGTDLDPLFVASNLPDLLGMRLLGEYTRDNVAALLPRVTSRQLLGYFELPLFEADLPRLPGDLAEAAGAAFALTSLAGRGPEAARARRAAVAAVPEATTAELAAELAIGVRAARRLRGQSAAPEGVRAVRLQLHLRATSRQERARKEQAGGASLPLIGRC